MDIQFLLNHLQLDKDGIAFSMYVLGTIVKNQMNLASWAYFYSFGHVSGFLAMPCCFG